MAAFEDDLRVIEARPLRQWFFRVARWLGLRR